MVDEFLRLFHNDLTKADLALSRLTAYCFLNQGKLQESAAELSRLIELGVDPFTGVGVSGHTHFVEAIHDCNLPLARWYLKNHYFTLLSDYDFELGITDEFFGLYLCEAVDMYDCGK